MQMTSQVLQDWLQDQITATRLENHFVANSCMCHVKLQDQLQQVAHLNR